MSRVIVYGYKNMYAGLEKWLSGQHRLLFQRSQAQFPATAWQLTALCTLVLGDLMPFSNLRALHTHRVHRYASANIHAQNKIKTKQKDLCPQISQADRQTP